MTQRPIVLTAHLHLRLEPTLLLALERAAAADGRTASVVARRLIEQGLAAQNPARRGTRPETRT